MLSGRRVGKRRIKIIRRKSPARNAFNFPHRLLPPRLHDEDIVDAQLRKERLHSPNPVSLDQRQVETPLLIPVSMALPLPSSCMVRIRAPTKGAMRRRIATSASAKCARRSDRSLLYLFTNTHATMMIVSHTRIYTLCATF